MTHKEMTAHIRNRIKVAAIKAHVSKYDSCGCKFIRVSVPSPEVNFTPTEQYRIKFIAKTNGLAMARGLEITIENATNPQEFHFLMQ
jgi:hypothetical protein